MLHQPSSPTLSSLPISFNKSIFFSTRKISIYYWIAERKDRVGEPGRRSTRLGDDFDWQGGHCANHEVPKVSLRGSFMLITPSLNGVVNGKYSDHQERYDRNIFLKIVPQMLKLQVYCVKIAYPFIS